MSDLHALLARCQALGAELTPTPHGTLKVKAPVPLPAALKDELRQYKAEVLALLTAPRPFQDDSRERGPSADAWPCPHCGQPATIEDVFPSADGERTLTMWSCEPCQVVAVTPDSIRLPPMNWIKRTQQ
jgi:hypothetical protein